MSILLLSARLLLAAVFALAGLSKLLDRTGTRRAVEDFGVPSHLAAPVAVALPLVELAVAVALLPTSTARWGALGALVLLLIFVVGIGVNLARGRRPDCHCFGQLHSAPAGWRTLSRNAVLAGVAGLVISQGWNDPGASMVAWLALLSPVEMVGLVAIVLLAALVALQSWFGLNLLRQQGRLLLRLEALEQAAQPSAPAAAQAPALGLPVGSPAPEFKLPTIDGELVTLEALRAGGKPVVLLFTDPGCRPCISLLPDVVRWQHQYAGKLALALISSGALEANRAKASEFELASVLVQQRHEVAEAYRYAGTPSAVVVDTDGRIATPVAAGADAVRSLLERMVSGLPLAVNGGRSNGHVLHAANGHRQPAPHSGPRVGESAPAFSLPNLDGHTVNGADLRGESVLMVFWNPSCGYCQQLLPDLVEWAHDSPSDAPQLVLVSNDSGNLAETFGSGARILLDPSGQVMSAFGATGTPMAVLLDSDGNAASELAAGGAAVLALVATPTPINA